MTISWKSHKKLNKNVVLKAITATTTVVDGRASFSGFKFYEHVVTLKSMLTFPGDIADVEKNRLIHVGLARAIGEHGKASSADQVLEAMNRFHQDENRKPEQSFHLLTGMSIAPGFKGKVFKQRSGVITFVGGAWPRKFTGRDAQLAAVRIEQRKGGERYQNMVVTVKAKTVERAATLALQTLDLQRGVWCFLANYSMQWRGDPWAPINRIRLAQSHTLHLETGEPASEGAWYEPHFVAAELFKADHPEVFMQQARWVQRRMQRSPYSSLLEEVLIRYVRAFDEVDQNTALIRLWSVLEALAAPGQQNGADQIVRRCSSLFDEVDYQRQILEHLREYRNGSVHAGDQSENALMHCYQLQNFFRALFWFHLRNAGKVDDIADANAILDLPNDSGKLRKLQQRIQAAPRARRPKGPRDL